ncbi:branched-chain amino acid ABC transporter permease/ATP-binding protein [Pseudonocardia sp. NPDC049154]|uniref:branched-chain amino acid ABC transporter permease/ATP-binding protein n=1 Tax=Pseudonocardia sp. NPDC049154 TaxID=3155501 RepID=UPI00340625E7
MTEVLRFILLGLGAGALYVLSATGLVLIYRGSGVVNFAHGAMGMVGAYTFWELSEGAGWPTVPAAIAGILVSAVLGALTHLLVMRPLRNSSVLLKVIATLAIMAILQAVAALRYPMEVVVVPSFLPTEPWSILGVTVGADRVLILVLVLVLTAALWAVYKFTTFGLATTATSENPRAASTLGLSPDRVAVANWAIGAGLSGMAGIFLVPIIGLSVTGLTLLVIPVLAAAVVGRFSSFPLTLAAGLGIGVLQSVATRWVPGAGVPGAVPFIVVAIVLISRGSRVPGKGEQGIRLPSVGSGLLRPVTLTVPIVLALVLIWAVMSPVWLDAMTVQLAVAIVVLSVVVVTGFAGQLSLAQFALAGVGALGAGLLVEHLGMPFLLAALIGALLTVPLGFVVGLAGVRTRGVALGIVTLGLAVALEGMVFTNPDYTGGLDGLRVGPQDVFGLNISQVVHPERYATLVLIVLVIVSLGVANVRRGRVGRRMIAVRANERAASALGIAVTRVKLYAFMLGAAVAGLGGVFIAFRNPTLNYNDFATLKSITVLQEGVIGSVGWVSGAFLGAGLEPGALGSQVLHLLGRNVETYIFLIGGVLLLVTILQFPNGLAAMHSELADKLRLKWHRKPAAPVLDIPETVTGHRVAPKSLAVEDLTARFGGVTALAGLDLTVEPGEIVGLIGPNGAGKSTAVEGITGFIPNALSGRVLLDGQPIDSWSRDRRARQGLGRSFQSLELFDDMTVLENLQAASEPQDVKAYVTDLVAPGRTRVSAACLAAIREFGLEEYLHVRPTELPYGRRRLVAIARAVAAEPSVLLLDEPAAGLDEVESRELGDLIIRLAREWGMAVLLIEHDVSMVMRLCDRIYALEFGKCIASGTAAEIRTDERVVASYLGSTDEETPAPAPSGTPVPAGGEAARGRA